MALAALDPSRGYASALRTHLPAAVRVLDAFHVIKLGSTPSTPVRRRVQQEKFGHRGCAGDPLHGIRRALRRGHDHPGDRSWTRPLHGLDLGELPTATSAAVWIAAPRTSGCSTATTPRPRRRGLPRVAHLLAPTPRSPNCTARRTRDSWRDALLGSLRRRRRSPTGPPRQSTC